MIIGTAIPLALRSGRLLLDGVPRHVNLSGVQEDIERITGEFSVHELHIWSLSELSDPLAKTPSAGDSSPLLIDVKPINPF